MAKTIKNNKRNLELLNRLISDGHYVGVANNQTIQLSRPGFPQDLFAAANHEIIGVPNEEGYFIIKSSLKSPLNILARIVTVFGVGFSIYGLLYDRPGFFLLFVLAFIMAFGLDARKQKKELDLFDRRLLHLSKLLE